MRDAIGLWCLFVLCSGLSAMLTAVAVYTLEDTQIGQMFIEMLKETRKRRS